VVAPKPVVRGHRLAIGWPAELCWSAVTERACNKREMGPDRRPGAVAGVFNLKIVPPKPCTTWTPDTAERGQVRRLRPEVFDERKPSRAERPEKSRASTRPKNVGRRRHHPDRSR
jgi:hypothetical protein